MSDNVISFPGYLRDGPALHHAGKRYKNNAALIAALSEPELRRICRWEFRRYGKELVARLFRGGGNAA
jgi:hypothetical protein